MKPLRGMLVAALAAVFVFALASTIRSRPITDAKAAAYAALAQRSGSDCVQGGYFSIDVTTVDSMVAKASPGIGWIIQDRVYVGDLAAAVQSIDGTVISEDEYASWVLTQRQTVRVLAMTQRGSLGKPAYFVAQFIESC